MACTAQLDCRELCPKHGSLKHGGGEHRYLCLPALGFCGRQGFPNTLEVGMPRSRWAIAVSNFCGAAMSACLETQRNSKSSLVGQPLPRGIVIREAFVDLGLILLGRRATRLKRTLKHILPTRHPVFSRWDSSLQRWVVNALVLCPCP